MKCPKCGNEERINEADDYCCKCGYPLKSMGRGMVIQDLKTLYLDTENRVLMANGTQIKGVTAFSLKFKKGKYCLFVKNTNFYEFKCP